MREWWRDAVIYQIYPRSYQDTTGNGIGDLAGITQRLPHVASLGVDAIWLSPFFTSPDLDMGYDVSDYTGVNPLFGTIDDFDTLVTTAHDLGLRVIIDQVLSHSSIDHPWFSESRKNRTNPKADWYVWADPKDDGSPPNNWLSVFGGSAWQFDTQRKQYYMHNFLTDQPDINFHCPAAVDALLASMKFWLDRGGWTGSGSIRSTSTSMTANCGPIRARAGRHSPTIRMRRKTTSIPKPNRKTLISCGGCGRSRINMRTG